ncbi:MAG: nucleotidyltransferase family protein [Porticoccaceae bacterium]|jgi:MurNAc alpha-1-phosphate uridylyltransferase|nr:nucleotidyltransferase family protein [Porticoccaceae bacterium]MBT3797502.1 nucleotidyltransferase family protein [Porticoccaceae bacterium]MBT4164367.1 nucleotidyltransferase family protein [Porticoccaceae bacterium]MBT4211319.1 nucleotidyltransferase family protein [Porticoccaceae bacterium]MBT4590672.1 nucleotidyltransferase family protein [Porticoccaceae bacterium]|tara:strand:- start:111 stop:800 length:690 start_codon:yes stop_codon:yes gene_type:complete
MKAMILAAGLGARLRPLTDRTPKPMIKVAGKPLLEHLIERLVGAGITEVVINVSWLADQIEDYFSDGSQFGVTINWSREDSPLETGGGISNALPILGSAPFLLISGDIWTDFPIETLVLKPLESNNLAHLVLVDNPEHNLSGDFSLEHSRVGFGAERHTYSGISILSPELFKDIDAQGDIFPLRNILRPAILSDQISGTLYSGEWCDVGTLERYTHLTKQIAESQDATT